MGGVLFIADIQRAVAKSYAVPVSELIGRSYDPRYVKPRHMAMYLSVHHSRHGKSRIGDFFGGRDHTTILYAERKIAAELEKSTILQTLVNRLEARLTSQASRFHFGEKSGLASEREVGA